MTGSRTRSSTATVRPTDSNATPLARWAAIGEKMSRPWKLDEMTGSIRSRFSSARASVIPPSVSAASMSSPLSGPMRMSPRATFRAMGSRSVPTPGSTTATWMPTGMCLRAKVSEPAPDRIE
jgi:hypothetical protein